MSLKYTVTNVAVLPVYNRADKQANPGFFLGRNDITNGPDVKKYCNYLY